MVDARDIEALRRDPKRASSIAAALAAIEDADWTEWEEGFLADMAARAGTDDLSYRQAESLLVCQDKARIYRRASGFSIPILVANCHLARLDLDDESAAFIERLNADRPAHLRKRAAAQLIACARELGLIEGYGELA